MLPFPVHFPSWHYWWTVSFPSVAQHGAILTDLTPTVWLHLPPSLKLPPRPNHPSEKDDLSSSDRILISNMPNDCLSWPMGLSTEHWDTAKMPTLQPGQEDVSGLWSSLFSNTLVHDHREVGTYEFFSGEKGWWSAVGWGRVEPVDVVGSIWH